MSARRDGRLPVGAGEPRLVRPRPQLSAPRAQLNGCGFPLREGRSYGLFTVETEQEDSPLSPGTHQVLLRVGET